MNTQLLINEFLNQKRFALIGASRNSNDFSRSLMREFLARGYDVVPINPHATEIENRRCFREIQDVQPTVTSAIILTPKDSLEGILRDCVKAGVTFIWLYGINGPTGIPASALEICRKNEVKVIPGYCPFMFLGKAGWFHRLHGTVNKLIGRYPT